MYIVILGAPGAGKGTQAAIICQEMNLPHIASGDLFRQALEKKTKLGLLAKSYMEKGKLGPDEITINMILERISSPDCASGCLFDGFPRTLEQAKALDKALAGRGKSIDKAIYIEVSDEELMKRLSGRWICRSCQTPYNLITSPPKVEGKCDKCGAELYQRPDDKEEVVRERLKVFQELTIPILDYYRKQHKLIKVNGNSSILQVTKEILSILKEGR
ncbi:MAG TPA: adenylate kinase [Dehalococcoidia bacterium]|nr:adenylate kinase [Dehalococcoidia bacterium]